MQHLFSIWEGSFCQHVEKNVEAEIILNSTVKPSI